MTDQPVEKKIEVDDSWKAQAEREKQELGGKPGGGATPGGTGPAMAPGAQGPQRPERPERQLPPASFELLVEQFMTQALLALGVMAHPATGQRMRDMELAKHYIDLLAVVEEKTRGNLTPEEQRLLDTALYEARMQYVHAARGR